MSLQIMKLASKYRFVDPNDATNHSDVSKKGSLAWSLNLLSSGGKIQLIPGTYPIITTSINIPLNTEIIGGPSILQTNGARFNIRGNNINVKDIVFDIVSAPSGALFYNDVSTDRQNLLLERISYPNSLVENVTLISYNANPIHKTVISECIFPNAGFVNLINLAGCQECVVCNNNFKYSGSIPGFANSIILGNYSKFYGNSLKSNAAQSNEFVVDVGDYSHIYANYVSLYSNSTHGALFDLSGNYVHFYSNLLFETGTFSTPLKLNGNNCFVVGNYFPSPYVNNYSIQVYSDNNIIMGNYGVIGSNTKFVYLHTGVLGNLVIGNAHLSEIQNSSGNNDNIIFNSSTLNYFGHDSSTLIGLREYSGGTIPTIPQGTLGIWNNSGTRYLIYNDVGTMRKVQIT